MKKYCYLKSTVIACFLAMLLSSNTATAQAVYPDVNGDGRPSIKDVTTPDQLLADS